MTPLERTITQLQTKISNLVDCLPYADRSYNEEKARIAQLKSELAYWKDIQGKLNDGI